MSGIRKSSRLVGAKALCGHEVLVSIPPGGLGPVGRRRLFQATTTKCYVCREKEKDENPIRRKRNPRSNPKMKSALPIIAIIAVVSYLIWKNRPNEGVGYTYRR